MAKTVNPARCTGWLPERVERAFPGDTARRAEILIDWGWAEQDEKLSRKHIEDAIALCEENPKGLVRQLAHAYSRMALLLTRAGNLVDAVEYARKSFSTLDSAGEQSAVELAQSEFVLAQILNRKKDSVEAKRQFVTPYNVLRRPISAPYL